MKFCSKGKSPGIPYQIILFLRILQPHAGNQRRDQKNIPGIQ